MPQTKFDTGDVVQLASGGPKMTVVYDDPPYTVVNYYDEGQHQFITSLKISTMTLVKVETTPPPM